MDKPFWAQVAETIESYTKTIAVILGGVWAVYRFGLGREREPALGFEIKSSVKRADGPARLVSFDVVITNRSKVKLAANSAGPPAYTDSNETLKYPASLLLRQVATTGRHGTPTVWFDGSGMSPREGDIELDLLNDYVVGQTSDFYMEPGESYQLSTTVFLDPGTYIAMLTFIGTKLPDDFWRRTTVITVQ